MMVLSACSSGSKGLMTDLHTTCSFAQGHMLCCQPRAKFQAYSEISFQLLDVVALILHFLLLYCFEKINHIITLCRVSFSPCYTPLISIRHKKKLPFHWRQIMACWVAIGFASGDGNSALYACNLKYIPQTSNGVTAVNSASVKTWSRL